MKISRDAVARVLAANATGIDFDRLCRALDATADDRRTAVARVLKNLEEDGLAAKKKKQYVPAVPAPPDGKRARAKAALAKVGETMKPSGKNADTRAKGDRAVRSAARPPAAYGAELAAAKAAGGRAKGPAGAAKPAGGRTAGPSGTGSGRPGRFPDPRAPQGTSKAADDVRRVLDKHELPHAFPAHVELEAERARAHAASEIRKRRQAPGWIVTIDSEKAKDLDDAVSVEKKLRTWEVAVHIADVSFFVRKGSLLDQEAFTRGTSCYLIDQVVPMFPHALSNDLCSLNAGTPKLAFSAFMTFSRKGELLEAKFERTVIEVSRRLSYKEVEGVLRGGKDPDAKKIKTMADLAKILRERRVKAGALLFEVPSLEIELDGQGEPVAVRVPERLVSETVVEEFMLAANQAVAQFLGERGASLYRIHAEPDGEKLDGFYRFASEMGVKVPRAIDVDSMSFQRILDVIRTNPAAGVLNSLLIRALPKAVYSTDNPGHFGLAFADYTHFTSPIRRYPDLVVHRLLAGELTGKKAYAHRELEKIAAQSTEREQKAVEAERDIMRIKGARFLGRCKGETVKGRITGVASWGIFVTLLPYGLDGMLPVAELKDDWYELDQYGHSLLGRKKGKKFSIGDHINVEIKSTNPEKGFVDLVPAE